MRPRSILAALFVLSVLLPGTGTSHADPGGPNTPAAGPAGTAFTYQGQLTNSAGPVSGACGMAFRLYDDPTSGALVGAPITTSVTVTSGLFMVPLDFGGGAFAGQARWLDIRVKCGADPAFSPLIPRQALTAAPYALYALSTGALQGQPVSASAPAAGQVLKWNGSSWTPGTDNTGGGGAAWLITGNAGTAGSNFLGTTDNMTLTLAVNGGPALRLVPTGNSPNVLGGSVANSAGAGVLGATIGGGGNQLPGGGNLVSASYGTISGGNANSASGLLATVGGGRLNSAGGSSAVIGGGLGNSASGDYASVAGGQDNTASGAGAAVGGGGWNGSAQESNVAAAPASTIGGGLGNVITTSANYSTIGGGLENIAGGSSATVGGGVSNQSGFVATVAGGENNVANGQIGAIGGGQNNTASGLLSTVGGGNGNTAAGAGATIGGGGWNGSSLDGNYAGAASGTIGGGNNNTITSTAIYATIAGGEYNFAGGAVDTIAGGQHNTISGSNATVGGGAYNNASDNGATVGGGGTDGITFKGNLAGGAASTVGGGLANVISGTAPYATLAGGEQNTISGPWSFVAGGYANLASGTFASIGGGERNTASGAGAVVGGGGWNGSIVSGNMAAGIAGTVAGGYGNAISSSAAYATIGGGNNNAAGDWYATVPGGADNQALGAGSFAAGDQARALFEGDFVWSDRSPAPISSTVSNQFVVRASGGVILYSNANATVGAVLAAGSSSWSTVSDRNLKANFAPVDGLQILDALAGLPMQTWNYKTQAASIRHIGPMAQDFHAAFGVGENDTTISTVDAQGVALAAIQGLYALAQHQNAQIAAQQAQISALQAGQTDLNTRLNALAARTDPAPTASSLPWLLLAGLGLLNLGAAAGYLAARASRQRAPGGAA